MVGVKPAPVMSPMSGGSRKLDEKHSTTNENKVMPNYNKRERQPVIQTNPYYDRDPQQKDPDDQEADTWNPTNEQYAAFAKKDFELAVKNVRHALLGAGRPITLKEVKESTLHSIDVIERVLTSAIVGATVLETKGRYSLVKP